MEAGEAEFRARVSGSLRARRGEIERAVATRVFAISEPPESADPDYISGLRAALSAAVEYAMEAVELGERRAPDVPASLLAQARVAARNGVALDTVLRRYSAGHSLLSDFVLAEAHASPAETPIVRRILQEQAALFDRLVEAVSEEHRLESARQVRSPRRRRLALIERLLDGEQLDAGELGYEFDAFHVGLLCTGEGVEPGLRSLASEFDLRLLSVGLGSGRTWAWLGSRCAIERQRATEIEQRTEALLAADVSAGIGEPAEGLRGWRLSHKQAAAALPVGRYLRERVVRYAKVALFASAVKDELLCESLRQMYLVPLAAEPDGGETLRQTLRAYLATGRNVSSTAAALKVNRQTVSNRLRAFERRVSRQIDDCVAELETALELDRHLGQRLPAGSQPTPR